MIKNILLFLLFVIFMTLHVFFVELIKNAICEDKYYILPLFLCMLISFITCAGFAFKYGNYIIKHIITDIFNIKI